MFLFFFYSSVNPDLFVFPSLLTTFLLFVLLSSDVNFLIILLLSDQVLNGSKLPQEIGTNIKIVEALSRYAHSKMANCRYIIGVRTVIGSIVFASIYLDNTALIKSGLEQVDYHSVAWGVLLTLFVFICSGIIYVTINLFDILGYYFQIRFHKVNQDIEGIITARESTSSNVKVVEPMRQILVEHDSLCWKLDHYNRYWCLIVMITFFVQPTIFVYTMYEICFMWQTWGALGLLWALNLESAYLFTRMFLIGVALSDEVHHIYLRAVRASFAKYPLDLRLQVTRKKNNPNPIPFMLLIM